MRDLSYWACVVARDAETTIGLTMDSLLAQALRPLLVCVVDDGSTDRTPQILEGYLAKHPSLIRIISKPDRGYDIRRMPENINAARELVTSEPRAFEYSLISGDDCVYPANYCQYIIDRMEANPKLVVATGDWGVPSPLVGKMPTGSGRIVRESFWKEVGGRYPRYYGWEAWLLFRALQLGFDVRNFTELRYQHLRASGSQHRFRYWGSAMRALGYDPIFVFARFVKNAFSAGMPLRGNLTILWSYLFPGDYGEDPNFNLYEEDLRAFVSRYQRGRLTAALKALIGL